MNMKMHIRLPDILTHNLFISIDSSVHLNTTKFQIYMFVNEPVDDMRMNIPSVEYD
jgi:hypothetical protein